jgi:alanine racemase
MRFSSTFLVDLNLLEENFYKLRKLAPKNDIIFMVKANAYGHGLIEITQFAYNNLDIKVFGCASLGEAIAIKNIIKNSDIEIFVFSDLELETHLESYKDSGIFPVLSSLSQVKFIVDSKINLDLVIKINTGMNRLGLRESDFSSVIEYLVKNKVFSIKHLMTHFSHSFFKIKDGDKTNRQYSKFLAFKESLRTSNIDIKSTSVSNSGAIEQKFGLEETHIRPGLMLYGPRSVGSFKSEEALWDGKVISSLKTKIMSIEKVKKGTPVGYGGHTCHADGILAFVPLGYGDGILTYYSGANVYLGSAIGKIMGRVNMDMTAIHFNIDDSKNVKLGDEIHFWDHSESNLTEFSNQVKSIPYQVFTAVTSRVPKSYIYK